MMNVSDSSKEQINLFSNFWLENSFEHFDCLKHKKGCFSVIIFLHLHPNPIFCFTRSSNEEKKKENKHPPNLLSVGVVSLQYANTCHHLFNVLYSHLRTRSFLGLVGRWNNIFFNHKRAFFRRAFVKDILLCLLSKTSLPIPLRSCSSCSNESPNFHSWVVLCMRPKERNKSASLISIFIVWGSVGALRKKRSQDGGREKVVYSYTFSMRLTLAKRNDNKMKKGRGREDDACLLPVNFHERWAYRGWNFERRKWK